MIDRAALAPFLVHGGRVGAAREVFGDGDWLDLSTGIAPWPYPLDGIDPGFDRLPDPAALAALEAAAGAFFRVPAGRAVVAVPGTDLALRLLGRVIRARAPAVVRPGYAGHAAAWHKAMPVAWDDVAEAARRNDLVVLASPSNPDGHRLDPQIAVPAGTVLLVDEAYADPDPGFCASSSANIITVRSFGKFFGLPGVRLGFVTCAAPLAARLRGLLGDWPVSSAAIAIGTAAYRDRSWTCAQSARIADGLASLDRLLETTMPSSMTTPFRLIETPDPLDLFRHLAHHRILTRPFADRPDRLRIGLPADPARLAAALKDYRR